MYTAKKPNFLEFHVTLSWRENHPKLSIACRGGSRDFEK